MCRVDWEFAADGLTRLFKRLLYASPAGAHIFWTLRTTVAKLDAEHLKAYFKGQVRRGVETRRMLYVDYCCMLSLRTSALLLLLCSG